MNLLMENWRKYLGLGKKAEPEEEAPEPEEEEDEQSSMEANLAMLLMREEEEQATMMFEMLSDQLDLDLLATEIDDGLRAEWEALPATIEVHHRRLTPEERIEVGRRLHAHLEQGRMPAQFSEKMNFFESILDTLASSNEFEKYRTVLDRYASSFSRYPNVMRKVEKHRKRLEEKSSSK